VPYYKVPYQTIMNPIEHVWNKMKESLYRDFPQLVHLTGNEVNVQFFLDALKEASKRVPQALVDKLILSMLSRIAKLRCVQGWYTHY
jgi:transposase